MSTAILHAEINTIDIPIIRVLLEKFKAKKVVFEEEAYVPNEVTLQAMKEVEQMRRDKNTKFFDSTEDLLKSLKS